MAKITRFFTKKLSSGQIVRIEGEEARHMNVLRLNKGDQICLFDGTGNEIIGQITAIEPRKVEIKVSAREKVRTTGILVDIAISVPKGKRWDWLIQKATELGVSRIIPILTKRGVVIPKKEGKSERWTRIAVEAAKQSQRSTVPGITEPVKFDDLLDFTDEYDLKMIASMTAKQDLKHALQKKKPKRILCLIGPEGGFTDEEEDKAKKRGFTPVKLGKEILRVETAGIAMLAMIKYEYKQ
ncbi:16S rRNA (uracil(1498)-N(3))-methyltransferase [Candidatus Woesearchaeota archaeon]|nr:16S rRNA (uracil(1498)-N(3))-methyltransferase [Candidatus Woesearchaeota archaeon]MBW3006335.1 16S rRNA (uracil(1498)-N(3))-methyltransferase [Candidatus Woesearchaeota archaeon]